MRSIAPKFLPALGVVVAVSGVGRMIASGWSKHHPVASEGVLLGLLAAGCLGVLWGWQRGIKRIHWPAALAAPTMLKLSTLWTIAGVAGWWLVWLVWRAFGGEEASMRGFGGLWLSGCMIGAMTEVALTLRRVVKIRAARHDLRWRRWVRGLERSYLHAESIQDLYHRFEDQTTVSLKSLELATGLSLDLSYVFHGLAQDRRWDAYKQGLLHIFMLKFESEANLHREAPTFLGGQDRCQAVSSGTEDAWLFSLESLLSVSAHDMIEWKGAGEVVCLDFSQVEAIRDFLSRAWRTTHRKPYPGNDNPPLDGGLGVAPRPVPTRGLVRV